MLTGRTIALLQLNRVQEIKLLSTTLLTNSQEKDAKLLQQILAGT